MTTLQNLVVRHKPLFDGLAEIWLDEGAHEFTLLQGDQVIFHYPGRTSDVTADGDAPILDIPIFFNGRAALSMRLIGVDTALIQRRLDFQTQLLSEILSLEDELEGMTVELIDTQDQMLALYKLARSVRTQFELPVILETIVRESYAILKVENVSILLRTDDPNLIMQYPDDKLPASLLTDALREIQNHGYEILQPPKNYQNSGIYNGTIIPIAVQEKIIGCISFVNRVEGFDSPGLKLARALAEEASVQIEKVILHQRTLEQAKLGAELSLAANIQTQLLPQSIPQIDGVDLFAMSLQARQVGGDFYDMMYKEGAPLTIAVGDVAGKGMSAALLMAMTRTVFRTWTKTLATNQAGPLLTMVNDDLYDDYTQVSSFTTLFVGRYNPETRLLRYANAGHSPVIYYTKDQGAVLMTALDMPLGVLPDVAFEDASMTLNPGDVLIVATDGFSEAGDSGGNFFGYDRLLQIVENNAHQSAQLITRTLFDAIHLFEATSNQNDDQTLLVLKILE